MRTILAFIPNLLTLCNLISGCAAVVCILNGWFSVAYLLVVLAAVFDFFDGFAARLLHVSSAIGKELDSLADMVSFGVVPSMVIFQLMGGVENPYAWFGFVVAACSALRLAKFNLDERQTSEFRGVPTPACALFFVPMPYWVEMLGWPGEPVVLAALAVLFAALMVCDIPMFALKFKSFAVKNNRLRYVFLLLAVILIALFRTAAPTVIILLYIILSLGRAATLRKA